MSWKRPLRSSGARLLWALGLSRPLRVGRGRLTIVTFHRVLTDPMTSPLPHLAVTPGFLRAALHFFDEHYTCLTLREAVTRLREGAHTHRPLLAVTFDDGRKDNFLHALPALRATGVPATFFVPAASVDDPRPLWHDELAWIARSLLERGGAEELARVAGIEPPTEDPIRRVLARAKELPAAERLPWIASLRRHTPELSLPSWEGPMVWSELRQLLRDGHEIGSHSMTHDVLLEELGADPRREVAESRALLERKLEAPVTSFCFPTGSYDAGTLRAVREAGYTCAVTTHWGANTPETDPFELRRFDIQGTRNSSRRGELDRSVLAWRLSSLPGTPG